jgi:hypothetical protein
MHRQAGPRGERSSLSRGWAMEQRLAVPTMVWLAVVATAPLPKRGRAVELL